MATKYYMNVPGVRGEVDELKYLYWIEIYSFDWGTDYNRAAGTAKEATVMKLVDLSSANLRWKCVSGGNLGTVEIALLKVGKDDPLFEFSRYSLNDATITAYQVGDDSSQESVTFSFTSISIES